MDGLRDCRAPARGCRAGLARACLALRSVRFFDEPKEAFDERGVPLLALTLPQGSDHLVARPPRAVGSIVAHRDEGIGNRDDAGEQGDILTTQSIRIAGAVDPLVMVPDRR